MNFTPVSKEAFAIFSACSRSREYFGISVDPVSRNQFKLVWSFKMSKDQAIREGTDRKQVSGQVYPDENFNFCPYCGGRTFVQCGKCGRFFCYNEEARECPLCHVRIGGIEAASNFSFGGGGY